MWFFSNYAKVLIWPLAQCANVKLAKLGIFLHGKKVDFVEEGKGQGSVPRNLPGPGKRSLVEEDNVAWSVVLLNLVNRERHDSETMRWRVALRRGLAAGILEDIQVHLH